MSSDIGDWIYKIIEAVVLLYVLYEFIKAFMKSSPGFGHYAWPIFLAVVAGVLAYAKLGPGRR